MELFMYILRGMYITNILIICVLVVKKILMHKNKKNTEFYYENWIFGVGLFTSILYNITFFMSDLIANSWQGLKLESLILLTVMNIINILVTFMVYIGSKRRLNIKSSGFTVYKLFTKREIMFEDIDTQRSAYVYVVGKSTKLFPKKSIFTSSEYFYIVLKNGEELKINLNPFILTGNRLLMLTVVVNKLKIQRKTE